MLYAAMPENLLWWLAAGSVVMFLASPGIVGFLLVRMPADYFVRRTRPPAQGGAVDIEDGG